MSKHINKTEKHSKCCICGEEIKNSSKSSLCSQCLQSTFECEKQGKFKSNVIKCITFLIVSVIFYVYSIFIIGDGSMGNCSVFKVLTWIAVTVYFIMDKRYRR